MSVNKQTTVTNELNKDDAFPDLKKIDPGFVEIVQEYYKKQEIEPSAELRERVMELARAHKIKVMEERKLNNANRLKWLEPIITHLKKFQEQFRLQGFPIIDFRVAAAAMVLMVVCLGSYYFIYKKNEEPVLISKNTAPTPKATGNLGSVERTIFGEGKGKELKEVKIVLLRFSEDEKALLLKEKIIDELKKGQFTVTEDPTKADAMLSVNSQNGDILIQLENVEEKVLWSKSISSNIATSPLLEDLFLRIQKEK